MNPPPFLPILNLSSEMDFTPRWNFLQPVKVGVMKLHPCVLCCVVFLFYQAITLSYNLSPHCWSKSRRNWLGLVRCCTNIQILSVCKKIWLNHFLNSHLAYFINITKNSFSSFSNLVLTVFIELFGLSSWSMNPSWTTWSTKLLSR